MKINKNYLRFMQDLDKHNIGWCLIKDIAFLLKTGYDNEIDIVANSDNRERIRAIGRRLGWKESALNKFNTHLIFWKFEGLKPFRIDVHLGRVLATAVPWFKSEDIIKDRIKTGNIWTVSPKWELVILLVASLRGRKPKPHRIERARELKPYLDEAGALLKKHVQESVIRSLYRSLIEKKIIKFSRFKRLGIMGVIKEWMLYFLLIASRLKKLSPVVILTSSSKKFTTSTSDFLINALRNSKIHVESDTISNKIQLNNPSLLLKRIKSDIVIIKSNIPTKNAYSLDLSKSIKENASKIISNVYH